MNKTLLNTLFFLSCGTAFSQVQAVYDTTLHQQMVICHNAKVRSDDLTRAWLNTILQQIQINAKAFVDCHKETYEKLKEIDERIGDPAKLNVNMSGVAPGQEYGNKTLSKLREEGITGALNTNCDAEALYGADAEAGRAEKVVEAAYVNYESVLAKTAEDKAILVRKREALIDAIPQLTSVAQLEKLKLALSAVDSKLKSLAEIEKNAALKVLVSKARNEEQRKLKDAVDDAIGAQMTVSAMDAMTTQMEENMKASLKDLRGK